MQNNPDIYYVDSFGYMDLAPPNDSTNFHAPFKFSITFPLSHRQCRFIGRHRCCPSPPKRRHHCNYHVTSGSVAGRRNEKIVNEAWSQKQKILSDLQHTNSPYTRIECAFAASSVSMTTAEEMEQDKTSAKKAAVALRSVIENIDAAVFSTTYTDTTKIDTIQDEGPNNPAVPPKIIETTTTPNAPEISYTMGVLLDRYKTLDKESKNEQLHYAIFSGNENLQSCILMLQQGKSGTTIAKLTKEWIKLAESYKVPELKFDEQASK